MPSFVIPIIRGKMELYPIKNNVRVHQPVLKMILLEVDFVLKIYKQKIDECLLFYENKMCVRNVRKNVNFTNESINMMYKLFLLDKVRSYYSLFVLFELN